MKFQFSKSWQWKFCNNNYGITFHIFEKISVKGNYKHPIYKWLSNKILKNAPKFYNIAKRIIDITDNCVLVAHNASFDYRILKTEFCNPGPERKFNAVAVTKT